MGLDWNPANKPLPGHEREAETLRAALLCNPSVESVSDAWNLRSMGIAAALSVPAWALGWFLHPVRSALILGGLVHIVGWPVYARLKGLRFRAATALYLGGVWNLVAAWGFLAILVGLRPPVILPAPIDGTMSSWIGWGFWNGMVLLTLALLGVGLWACGWRLFDPRRARRGLDPDALRQRFFAITEAAYTTVGAPVVGTDPSADAWVLEHVRRSPEEDTAALLGQLKGYRVLQLAPRSDGLPVYTNAVVNRHLELISFRGEFLKDCEAILGKELLEAAWETKSPEALVAYGEALLARVRPWAAERGVSETEHHREGPDDPESDAGRAHIVFSAAKWCIYWGSRGHGLDPWF